MSSRVLVRDQVRTTSGVGWQQASHRHTKWSTGAMINDK